MLYLLTAFALSFAWLGVLAIVPGFGLAIRGGIEEVYSLPNYVIWMLFPVISVLIALTFKQWILKCRGWKMILPAVALPWIGSLIIAVACGIAAHTLRDDPNGGFLGAVWFASLYTALGLWIIAPMGLVSQILLLATVPTKPIEETEQVGAGDAEEAV